MRQSFEYERSRLEQEAKSDWASDASIREEFSGDFDSYLAFRAAEAAGIVRLRDRAAEHA